MRLTADELANLTAKPGYSVDLPGFVLDSAPSPKLERSASPGALGKSKVKKGDPRRFLIRVTSYRRRLIDEDNLCEKYHVDCCRYAGLLPSDDPGKAKIEVSQKKVRTKEEERTEIQIEELL